MIIIPIIVTLEDRHTQHINSNYSPFFLRSNFNNAFSDKHNKCFVSFVENYLLFWRKLLLENFFHHLNQNSIVLKKKVFSFEYKNRFLSIRLWKTRIISKFCFDFFESGKWFSRKFILKIRSEAQDVKCGRKTGRHPIINSLYKIC